MNTITLIQVRNKEDVYLYPDGDLSTCTEFTSVGGVPNYTCVDEDRLIPDDDTSYVYWSESSTATDLYTLPSQPTYGTIHYVQVYNKVKSNGENQHVNGIYKITCSPDSTCTHIYKSNDIDLTTDYITHNKVWTTNPLTSTAWTWDNINTLCIGQETSSPTKTFEKTLTLRPNATGDLTEFTRNSGNTNWARVDDVIADNWNTYILHSTGYDSIDLYNIPNHTAETGVITNIAIFAQSTNWVYLWGNQHIILKTGGSISYSPLQYLTGSFALYSHNWANNPQTGVAWTWADIDNLQIGLRGIGDYVLCTQIYIVVSYNETRNPPIHTTQTYAKVNYNAEETCTLNSPKHISTNHARNVKMLNFWNGTREVYDLSRGGKTMVLTGMEFQHDTCSVTCPCERIQCVRDMGENGNIVSITGLSLNYFNGNYRIRSFGWKHVSEKPEVWEWILNLEQSEL